MQHKSLDTHGLLGNPWRDLEFRLAMLEHNHQQRLEHLERQLALLRNASTISAIGNEVSALAPSADAVYPTLSISNNVDDHPSARKNTGSTPKLPESSLNVSAMGLGNREYAGGTFFADVAPADLTGTLLRLVEGRPLSIDAVPRPDYNHHLIHLDQRLRPPEDYALPSRQTASQLLNIFEEQTWELYVSLTSNITRCQLIAQLP